MSSAIAKLILRMLPLASVLGFGTSLSLIKELLYCVEALSSVLPRRPDCGLPRDHVRRRGHASCPHVGRPCGRPQIARTRLNSLLGSSPSCCKIATGPRGKMFRQACKRALRYPSETLDYTCSLQHSKRPPAQACVFRAKVGSWPLYVMSRRSTPACHMAVVSNQWC